MQRQAFVVYTDPQGEKRTCRHDCTASIFRVVICLAWCFAFLQSRGCLHTAGLSLFERNAPAAAPQALQQLLQQAAAQQLQARVLLLHGPSEATAAAAAAAQAVLPEAVVADAESLIALEQQQQEQQQQQPQSPQHQDTGCCYCGNAASSCSCLSDVRDYQSTRANSSRIGYVV